MFNDKLNDSRLLVSFSQRKISNYFYASMQLLNSETNETLNAGIFDAQDICFFHFPGNWKLAKEIIY